MFVLHFTYKVGSGSRASYPNGVVAVHATEVSAKAQGESYLSPTNSYARDIESIKLYDLSKMEPLAEAVIPKTVTWR